MVHIARRTMNCERGKIQDRTQRLIEMRIREMVSNDHICRTRGNKKRPRWKDEEAYILLQLPFTIVERTDVSCLQPSRDAMEMESVLVQSYIRSCTAKKRKGLTLQIPHAALHSSLVAETWLAWQSIPEIAKKSRRWYSPINMSG